MLSPIHASFHFRFQKCEWYRALFKYAFFIFCSSVLFLLRGAGFCFRELVESGRGEGKRQKIEGDKRDGEKKERQNKNGQDIARDREKERERARKTKEMEVSDSGKKKHDT